MAQAGYTPISLYYSTTASAAPSAGNLVAGELALNTVDEKLYFKNSSGVVKLLASNAGALGSVTSVAQTFTGGLISVSGSPITSSGTLALAVAGTSGGIPYFSSSSTWASSAALAANSLVIGGGAGVAPSTTATGTNVLTALGVNVGTAGAFVVNGGALGTPSSGTLTNVSGLPLSTGVTGTLAVGNGGTGQTTYTDGQLLIGNSTGNTLTKATLTAGTGISVTNGSGSISIANTGVTSVGGTGTVNGITLTGSVTTTGNLTLGGTLSGVSLTTQVTGTLPVANGGTGQTTYTDGQLLIGNTIGNTLTKATLTAGTGITITNGNGSITIAGNTGTVTSVSGTGTVNGITLTGTVTSSGSLTLGGTLSGVSLTTQVTGTLPVANGGTGVTSSTGTGSVVLSTSPTLTTPNLGTPSAVTLTNATGLPLTTGVTGTLPIANGGTGSTATAYCSLTTNVTGTLPVANGGTGQTTYTDGQLLIGNTIGNTLTKATLTAGSGISITNGNGSITIANTGGGGTVTSVSGTGTVNGITLTGTVTSSGNLTLGGTLSGVSLTTQVTGTLPVANGGSGATTLTGVLKGNGTSAFTASNVNLASEVTGTLPVANGGTGSTTLTANNVLLGNGTSALQVVAPGTSGNVLSSNGTTWASSALTATQVSNAYAGLTAGAVGTLAMLEYTAGSTVAFGGTESSANLQPSNAAGGNSGTVSGTWRCLGYADGNGGNADRITLWVRTV